MKPIRHTRTVIVSLKRFAAEHHNTEALEERHAVAIADCSSASERLGELAVAVRTDVPANDDNFTQSLNVGFDEVDMNHDGIITPSKFKKALPGLHQGPVP